MSDWDDDEPLGYGRPPKYMRFKKGQSGNPRGRPRKKREPNFDTDTLNEQHAILRAEIDRKVRLTEGGEVKEVSIQEAITKAQAAQAVNGSPLAQREILNRIDRLMNVEAQERQSREEREQASSKAQLEQARALYEYFTQLKQNQTKAWARAEASGNDEPDFPWPHPDDILLDEGRKQYRLRGPMEPEAVPLYNFMRAERDTCLARVAQAVCSDGKSNQALAKLWGVFVYSHDKFLPLRWQIGDAWDDAILDLLLMSPNEIEQETERRASEALILKSMAGIESDPDSYAFANEVLWPTLDRQNYRSLAQFEKAYEDTDGNPPWPRRRKQPETIG